MRADAADKHDGCRVVEGHNQPKIIAFDIEYNSAFGDDASI